MTTAPGTPSKAATNIDPRRDLPEATRASKIDLSPTHEHASSEKLREAQGRLCGKKIVNPSPPITRTSRSTVPSQMAAGL